MVPRGLHLCRGTCLERVDPDRPQELVARRADSAANLDEARVDETGDRVEDIQRRVGRVDDLGDEGGVGVGDHDSERDHHAALDGTQAGHALVQGRPQAGPTSYGRAGPAAHIRFHPFGQLVQAEEVEMAGHELQAERQPVDERAQPIGCRELGGLQLEVWVDQLCAIDQELEGLGSVQGADRYASLIEHPKAFPARGHHPHPRTRRQDGFDLGRDFTQPPFAFIEDEEAGGVCQFRIVPSRASVASEEGATASSTAAATDRPGES